MSAGVPMCSCGHTVGSHHAEPYCPGCDGDPCDLDFAEWLTQRELTAAANALNEAAAEAERHAISCPEGCSTPSCANHNRTTARWLTSLATALSGPTHPTLKEHTS